jgi:hypothetical protein
MSGEWQCPGCDYETEALCDNEHVYECLVKNAARIAELEAENKRLRTALETIFMLAVDGNATRCQIEAAKALEGAEE